MMRILSHPDPDLQHCLYSLQFNINTCFLIPAGNLDECRSTNPQPRRVISFFGDIFMFLLGVTGQGRISLKGKRYCILVLWKC
jgi:hypothetical protein